MRLPPERIEAAPLVLRRARVEDAEQIAAAVRANLDHLRPWMPWAADDQSTDPDFQRERLEGLGRAWDRREDLQYLFLDGSGEQLVGTGGLMAGRVGAGALEIGYWIDRQHTGRGLATAGARALADAGLVLDGIDRIEIHCDEANVASACVARKAGFRLDRIEQDEVAAPGEVGRSMIWVRP